MAKAFLIDILAIFTFDVMHSITKDHVFLCPRVRGPLGPANSISRVLGSLLAHPKVLNQSAF